MPVCLNHPHVQATHFCAACHKPLCDSCSLQINGEVFCSEECRQKYEAA